MTLEKLRIVQSSKLGTASEKAHTSRRPPLERFFWLHLDMVMTETEDRAALWSNDSSTRLWAVTGNHKGRVIRQQNASFSLKPESKGRNIRHEPSFLLYYMREI